MKLTFIFTLIVLVSSFFQVREKELIRVSNASELIAAMEAEREILITSDTIDLTGIQIPALKSALHGNGCNFIYTKLPSSGEVFMFNLDGGAIDSCTITGPNPFVMASGGYFGAIKSITGKITGVTFKGCDKYGVYVTGNRKVLTDSTFIDKCTFNGINRSGFGYGIWNQYGTAVVTNSSFDHCRHFIDCSSEAWVYNISGCTFGPSHWNYAIHNHEYPDGSGKSGTQFIFRNNYLFGKTTPMEIYRTSQPSVIENNKFEAGSDLIGKIAGKPLISDSIFKSNSTGGKGMLQPPVTVGEEIIKPGQKPVWKSSGYKQSKWIGGNPDAAGSPQIKTYEVYGLESGIRSITTYKTLIVRDTGNYLGFRLKVLGCKAEVLSNGTVIAKITSPEWTSYLYRGPGLSLRITGIGEVYIDDWHRENLAESFETTSKVKINYNGTKGVKASRWLGESASGIWSLRITLTQNGSIGIQ